MTVPAHPVHGRVGQRHLARPGSEPAHDRGDVGAADVGADPCVGRDRFERDGHRVRFAGVVAVGDPVEGGRQTFLVGRADLRSVGQVHLVAVVGRRVVGRGDGDPGPGGQVAHRERHQRRGHRPRKQHRPATEGGDDPGHVGGEDVGVPAGVVADHDRGPLGQQRDEGGGGAPHHQAVHAGRARPHGSAEAGGAQADAAGEGRRQRLEVTRLGPGDQAVELGAAVLVRVETTPPRRGVEERGTLPHGGGVGRVGRRHCRTVCSREPGGAGRALGPRRRGGRRPPRLAAPGRRPGRRTGPVGAPRPRAADPVRRGAPGRGCSRTDPDDRGPPRTRERASGGRRRPGDRPRHHQLRIGVASGGAQAPGPIGCGEHGQRTHPVARHPGRRRPGAAGPAGHRPGPRDLRPAPRRRSGRRADGAVHRGPQRSRPPRGRALRQLVHRARRGGGPVGRDDGRPPHRDAVLP